MDNGEPLKVWGQEHDFTRAGLKEGRAGCGLEDEVVQQGGGWKDELGGHVRMEVPELSCEVRGRALLEGSLRDLERVYLGVF